MPPTGGGGGPTRPVRAGLGATSSSAAAKRVGLLLLVCWVLFVASELLRSPHSIHDMVQLAPPDTKPPPMLPRPQVQQGEVGPDTGLAARQRRRKAQEESAQQPQGESSASSSATGPTALDEAAAPLHEEDDPHRGPQQDHGLNPKHDIHFGHDDHKGKEDDPNPPDHLEAEGDTRKGGMRRAAAGDHHHHHQEDVVPGEGKDAAVHDATPDLAPHEKQDQDDEHIDNPHLLGRIARYSPKAARHSAASPFKLVLFTTLKPCDDEEHKIYAAQLAAIESWVSIPLDPPPTVLIMGPDPCGARIIQQLNVSRTHQKRKGKDLPPPEYDIRVITNRKLVSKSGTVLLGAAVKAMEAAEPHAHAYGLVNADIIISPSAAVALRISSNMFLNFFMVGRRSTVELEPEDREHIDIPSRRWEHSGVFQQLTKDRIDAEDYFIWTSNFFVKDREADGFPDFHIGRPAYDNWFVHHAIHTWQPVIEATAVLRAFHQKHNYDHMRKISGKASYWAGEEQKKNYDLGIANGGWQHGLIEMAPLGFRCSKRGLTLLSDFSAHDTLGDWEDILDECHVTFKKGWKPLNDGRYGNFNFYIDHYKKSVAFGKEAEFKKQMQSFVHGVGGPR